MNFLGLVAALAAFFSIWFGHVAVRQVEFNSPTIWIPTTIFATMGLIVEFFSLSAVNRPLSTALGILGITLLFDALEFTRQQNRVKKGHAPASPSNPRHIKILAGYSSATTLDLLKRDPLGRVISTDEANQLISNL
jgi:uncharacterized protein DUF4491